MSDNSSTGGAGGSAPEGRPGSRRPEPPPSEPQSEGLAPWEIGRDPVAQPRQGQPPRPASAPGSGQGLAPWEIGGPVRPTQHAAAPVPPPAYGESAGPVYRPVQPQDFQVRDESGTRRIFGRVALCIAFLLIGWFIAAEFIPMPVGAPRHYGVYKSPDGRFAIDVPSSWAVTSNPVSPDGTIGIALFKDGPVILQVTTDTVAHMKGQVLLDSSAAAPADFTADPTKALNDIMAIRIASQFKDYKEGAPTGIMTNYGPAMMETFTGRGGVFGWGGPIHGYRVSVATDDTTFEIVAQAPDTDWRALSPALLRMIQSIGPVGGGVYTPPADDDSSPTPGIPSIPSAALGGG